MSWAFRRRRSESGVTVGVALGSGAARGWAHIGVLNALAEAGVPIGMVAGTSIGALVGAALASGKTDSLERVVRELDWKKAVALLDVGLPRSGLFDGRKVTDSIREHVESGEIQRLPLPFCAVSTDLLSGREVHIRSGDVIEAVRASISIPGVFTPVRRDGMLLVDGGLVNPVPADVVRGMGADYVIAVDLNYGLIGPGGAVRAASSPATVAAESAGRGSLGGAVGPLAAPMAAIRKKVAPHGLPGLAQARRWFSGESVPNILEVLMTSLYVMETQITEMRLAATPPDLLIRPRLTHLKLMDFHRGAEAIAEGYRAAQEGIRSAGASLPRR